VTGGENRVDPEKKLRLAIGIENGLILLAIVALWPVILGWPHRYSQPLLLLAVAVMGAVAWRRWRRLLAAMKEARQNNG